VASAEANAELTSSVPFTLRSLMTAGMKRLCSSRAGIEVTKLKVVVMGSSHAAILLVGDTRKHRLTKKHRRERGRVAPLDDRTGAPF